MRKLWGCMGEGDGVTGDDPQSHALLRAGYVGAVDHYTSPQRRDAVKRLWEEPELVRVLDTALRKTAAPYTTVVDVGCGTGVALQLLQATNAYGSDEARRLRYVGLDLDDALLRVATATHQPNRAGDEVSFVAGDIRNGLPASDVNLVVSCGVPFSHLTKTELNDTLTTLFSVANANQVPLVAVIDVLGRYSLEWVSKWQEERWSYRMSFFSTDQQANATFMTTYDATALFAGIASAAKAAGVRIGDIAMVDRSVMVGRHTMTGDYTPDLPSWRTLINALYDQKTRVNLDALRCTLPIPDAPEEISAFFDTFIPAWNSTIDQAKLAIANSDHETVVGILQPALFTALRDLEIAMQPGLGVGHSLTALVVLEPSQ